MLDEADRRELQAVFLAGAPARLRALEEAEEATVGDPAGAGRDALAREAHTLRGGAATAGFERLALLAGALERAAADGDVDDRVRSLVEDVAAEVALLSTPQRTVLCIDDDPTNRRLLERVAARVPGVRLLLAAGGEEGLALARRWRPQLVLLDLQLPGLSGLDVVHLLRQHPETQQTDVVMMSAEAMPERVEELRAAGATGYLTKPLDVARLLELLAG